MSAFLLSMKMPLILIFESLVCNVCPKRVTDQTVSECHVLYNVLMNLFLHLLHKTNKTHTFFKDVNNLLDF